MNWRPILVTLAWIALVVAVLETGAILVCSRWVWTPIERHYLPAYILCSLPIVMPATAEVRFIWKTGRHRKRELASDEDVDDSEDGTGMVLSQSARDAGWKTLVERPPQEVPTAKLGSDLAELAFENESVWSFLLLPEVCGIVAFGYGLYWCYRLGNLFMDWAIERSLKQQKTRCDEPSWSPLDRCVEIVQKLCSSIVALHWSAWRCIELRRTATNRTATNTSLVPSEPTKKPLSFAIPIFGVHNGTGDGYLWSKKDEIERTRTTSR